MPKFKNDLASLNELFHSPGCRIIQHTGEAGGAFLAGLFWEYQRRMPSNYRMPSRIAEMIYKVLRGESLRKPGKPRMFEPEKIYRLVQGYLDQGYSLRAAFIACRLQSG
jgi:hypothetical protein